MFFKEFWRYKNYYRALNKNQLIHNTDDTLNIEKLQAQSQISDYDPQNMSFKNLKMFFNIKKIFSNESKRSTIGIIILYINIFIYFSNLVISLI